MKNITFKSTGLSLLLGLFTSFSYADAVGTVPAYCFNFAGYSAARVLTWHSPLIHHDPNDYSKIGVKMKIMGAYPRESPWAEYPTLRSNSSWVAWYYYSTGTPPSSVSGLHKATLSLTGSDRGIIPTFIRCLG